MPIEKGFALASALRDPLHAQVSELVEYDRDRIHRFVTRVSQPADPATIEQLEKELLALVKERAAKKIKINWQFSLKKTRTKLKRHY